MRGRAIAALCALLAVLFAGGFFVVGALGRGSADAPLIVLDRSIGGVAIGMTQAQVEALYGAPDSTMAVVARGGGAGLLARYNVHGGVLIVVHAGGKVVSVETGSSFYRTNTRIGPGTSSAGLGGFHLDLCSGGLWDGSAGLPPDGVVTVFSGAATRSSTSRSRSSATTTSASPRVRGRARPTRGRRPRA